MEMNFRIGHSGNDCRNLLVALVSPSSVGVLRLQGCDSAAPRAVGLLLLLLLLLLLSG